MLVEIVDYGANALIDRELLGVECELGVDGRLVGRVDAGEVLNEAGARLLVESLHVALLAQLERRLDVYLDEWDA